MATRSRLGGLRNYEVSARCIADLDRDIDGDGTTVASNFSLLLAASRCFSRRGANERPLRMHLN